MMTGLIITALLLDVLVDGDFVLSGANVNATDQEWLTPLHRAAASHNEVSAEEHFIFVLYFSVVVFFHCVWRFIAESCLVASEEGGRSERSG